LSPHVYATLPVLRDHLASSILKTGSNTPGKQPKIFHRPDANRVDNIPIDFLIVMNGDIAETKRFAHRFADFRFNDISVKHFTHVRGSSSIGFTDDVTSNIHTELYHPGQVQDQDILKVWISSEATASMSSNFNLPGSGSPANTAISMSLFGCTSP